MVMMASFAAGASWVTRARNVSKARFWATFEIYTKHAERHAPVRGALMLKEKADEAGAAVDAGSKQQVTTKLFEVLPSPSSRLELE